MDHGKNKGFTLIEVLAAITLLSLVLLTFASSFIQGQQITTNNGVRQTALEIGQQELSKILSDGDSGHASSGLNATTLSLNNLPSGYSYYQDGSSLIMNKGTYQIFVFLQNSASSRDPEMVVVRVYYGELNSNKYIEVYNSLNS